jgi:hypothetical protein
MALMLGFLRYHTFRVIGVLQGHKVTIFIDGGESHNFINDNIVNSNLVQYLLQTDIQKRTEKIQWKTQTLHRDFSPGNPKLGKPAYIIFIHCLQYNIHIGANGIQNPNPMTWISPKP